MSHVSPDPPLLSCDFYPHLMLPVLCATFAQTIQLYEMIVVRHGLMTVGQPFSGKSSSLQVLAGALSDLHDQGIRGTLFNRIQVRGGGPHWWS